MLPAHNGVKVFSRLLLIAKKLYKVNIFYDVIGGWLPELLSKDRGLIRILSEFSGIWVETTTMMERLRQADISNVSVIRNFKNLSPAKINDEEEYEEPLKLCMFSRVMKEKGIEDAITAVKTVNEKYGETVYLLDIYGQVDDNYMDRFITLKAEFPEYISYKGVVNPSESVEIIKDYYALLFPTHYWTEGVPGTIIDAYFAGVPVISSIWESYYDVVEDNNTGYGYEMSQKSKLIDILYSLPLEKEKLKEMKKNCIRKSYEFSTVKNIEIIDKCLM
jgi:glycosyltransferase involved in cell wall biosynthesis